MIEHFLPHAEKAHSEEYFDRSVYVANAALAFLRGKALRQIKAIDVERFKAARFDATTMHGKARKPATVARELSVLSKIFSLAVKSDVLESNSCQRVEKPKFDNIQNHVLRSKMKKNFLLLFVPIWRAIFAYWC